MLILPGSPLYYQTLASPPPLAGGQERLFVVRTGSGILEPATPSEMREYLDGGEYDQRLEELEQEDDLMGWTYAL